jgi:hypothetical protein
MIENRYSNRNRRDRQVDEVGNAFGHKEKQREMKENKLVSVMRMNNPPQTIKIQCMASIHASSAQVIPLEMCQRR